MEGLAYERHDREWNWGGGCPGDTEMETYIEGCFLLKGTPALRILLWKKIKMDGCIFVSQKHWNS